MNRKYFILFLSTIVIVPLDQISKFYVDKYMSLNESVEMIGGLLNITYIRNKGAAFGLLSDMSVPSYFFVSLSVIALVGILYLLKKIGDEVEFALGLSLIFGGALGNLIDRARMGAVIDFMDFQIGSYHWPAFNIADACISIGVVILMLKLIRRN